MMDKRIIFLVTFSILLGILGYSYTIPTPPMKNDKFLVTPTAVYIYTQNPSERESIYSAFSENGWDYESITPSNVIVLKKK